MRRPHYVVSYETFCESNYSLFHNPHYTPEKNIAVFPQGQRLPVVTIYGVLCDSTQGNLGTHDGQKPGPWSCDVSVNHDQTLN